MPCRSPAVPDPQQAFIAAPAGQTEVMNVLMSDPPAPLASVSRHTRQPIIVCVDCRTAADFGGVSLKMKARVSSRQGPVRARPAAASAGGFSGSANLLGEDGRRW